MDDSYNHNDFLWNTFFSSIEIKGKFIDNSGSEHDMRSLCGDLAAIATTIEISKDFSDDFIVSESKISPPLVIHANLAPNAYVETRTKVINFNYGIIISAGALHCFLERLMNITEDSKRQMSFDEMMQLEITDEMIQELHRLLAFWNASRKEQYKRLIIPGGEWVSSHIMEIMIAFLFVHELSHWSVNIYKPEVRENLKMVIENNILEAFELFNSNNCFLKEARLFKDDEQVRKKWIEEIFADRQAFQYCVQHYLGNWAPQSRKIVYYAISLIQVIMSSLEFFHEVILGTTLSLTHPPSSLRKQLLAYSTSKAFDMPFYELYQKEWGVFLIADFLQQNLLDKYHQLIRG